MRQLASHNGEDGLDGGLSGQLGERLGIGGEVVGGGQGSRSTDTAENASVSATVSAVQTDGSWPREAVASRRRCVTCVVTSTAPSLALRAGLQVTRRGRACDL